MLSCLELPQTAQWGECFQPLHYKILIHLIYNLCYVLACWKKQNKTTKNQNKLGSNYHHSNSIWLPAFFKAQILSCIKTSDPQLYENFVHRFYVEDVDICRYMQTSLPSSTRKNSISIIICVTCFPVEKQ